MENVMKWHGKTHWLGCMPWARDIEDELLDWSAQPQYQGLVKGHYYSGTTHLAAVGDITDIQACWKLWLMIMTGSFL